LADIAAGRDRECGYDGSEFFDGRSAMLTLALEGRPAVTAFWKPGFPPVILAQPGDSGHA
jgi:hypothetical protein